MAQAKAPTKAGTPKTSAGTPPQADTKATAAATRSAATKRPVAKTPHEATPAVKKPAAKTSSVKTPPAETPATQTPPIKTPAAEKPAAVTPTADAPETMPLVEKIALRFKRNPKPEEVESRWPEDPDEKPFHGEGSRPWTVAAGALCAYILAAAYLAQGAGDPLGSGTGASGLAFIVVGVLVFGFTTLAIQGSKLGRACLTIPLVVGSAVVVNDDGQPAWIRIGSVVFAAAAIGFLMLEPRARVFFGDDDSPLLPPETQE